MKPPLPIRRMAPPPSQFWRRVLTAALAGAAFVVACLWLHLVLHP